MSVAKRFKGYFLHGLAVLLPSILTIWLLIWGYNFLQNNISRHINGALIYIIALTTYENVDVSDTDIKSYLLEKYPELKNDLAELEMRAKLPENKENARFWTREKNLANTWVDGPGSIIGFIIALVLVCSVGALLASYMGKTLWRMTENFIMNTPILKRIYPYIKQVTDFFLTQEDSKNKMFSRVVAVEYPRKGIWSLGFVTGSGFRNVVNNFRREFLTVFIPTTPTPVTGFVVTVPKKLTIDLDMTIEEALRFIISGGVIAPPLDPKQTNEFIKEDTKNPSFEN